MFMDYPDTAISKNQGGSVDDFLRRRLSCRRTVEAVKSLTASDRVALLDLGQFLGGRGRRTLALLMRMSQGRG